VKISVVTVAFNSAKTIAETLQSVSGQLHPEVEHIVVDGGSSDATLLIISEFGQRVARLVSEPDDGIYDAMNKGVALASGDVVCFLNSDDKYLDVGVLGKVANCFTDPAVDFVYGDLLMVNDSGVVMRSWRTGRISRDGLKWQQIPHPALFVRLSVLAKINPCFDATYKISADLKQQLIMLNKLKARGFYLSEVLVLMRVGGASTGSLGSYMVGWRESIRDYNDIFGSGGVTFTIRKVFSKVKGLRFS